MELTKLSVRRPLTMLMFILALVVLGFRGFTEMQVDRFPAVDFPFITVVTIFPGASPEDVEDLILEPIEDAIISIPGIDFIQSVANEGVGFIIVAFQEGVDGSQAAIDVDRQVATVKGVLPDDATDPSVVKADINALPIMNMIVSGSQSQDELFKIAEDVVKPRLQSVSGVASVNVSGGRDEIIAVQVDGKKLTAFNLPIGAVSQAFSLNNLTFPIGTLEEGRQKTTLRSVGSFQSLTEIENMVVSGAPGGQGGGGNQGPKLEGSDSGGLVFLRDVATISPAYADLEVIQRYNGQDTVNISVIKTTEANVIDVADSIHKRIDDLNQQLPGDSQITIISDDSQFIKNSVGAVEEDLILAILITGVVMLLFLHTIRSTFIVIMAIPTSLFSTFLMMWALGFTLNVLTLLALTLIIGILVDDSIVVLENIERHLKMKKKPDQAAIDGRAEIGLAAIAITLTDVVVYVPVAFTSGIVGQFFRSYGITIAVATMFSLFVSFTLAPMLAAYFLKDESVEEKPRTGLAGTLGRLYAPVENLWRRFIKVWEAGFVKLADVYAVVIGFSLKNFITQSAVVILSVLALLLSASLAPLIGFEFMPQEDDGRFSIAVDLPPGTNLAATNQAASQVEQIIRNNVPETVSILTRIGSAGGGNIFAGGTGGGSNTANINVQLVGKNDRDRSVMDIIDALRPLVSIIPDANVSIASVSGFGPPGSAITVQVSGADPNVLIDLANQVEEVTRNTPDIIDVRNEGSARAPETKIKLDRERLVDLGLSPAIVASTLRTSVTGSDAGDFSPEHSQKIKINVRLNEDSRQNLDDLLQMTVGYLQGKPVLLGQVAEIERSFSSATINRYNRQRVLAIDANVATADAGGVASALETRIAEQVFFPPDYTYQFVGMTETQQESFAQLGFALGLSILLIYMLLVALYQNFLQPLAIMIALPMALIGVLLGLFLTGNTLNIFSMLGIIMLAGVVTRNAILIIDFANQLQEEQGMERKAALVEAGRLRLRPIVMTSATLVFALMPVLLSTADGSESRQPLAAVLMGGSVTSGLLSLILIPVIYNAFEVLGEQIAKLFRWITGSTSTDTPPPAPAPVAQSEA